MNLKITANTRVMVVTPTPSIDSRGTTLIALQRIQN